MEFCLTIEVDKEVKLGQQQRSFKELLVHSIYCLSTPGGKDHTYHLTVFVVLCKDLL